jgi:tRNA-specific 2-thiouridylase
MAERVICAMSGGLDSSVAAALLKRAGFNVIGVFMKFWSEPQKDGLIGSSNRCCAPEAEIRARKVAKILKIPFYVFDFSKEFKERIVDYFLEGYKKGITPNPCVVCNKEIKFGLLLEKALSLDADFVATGHYARKIQNSQCKMQNENSKCKIFKLLRAKDKSKDQSYFLWMLNQEQLKRILFPIGDYTREEVENLARKFKLPVLGIKKSVEICFVQTTVNDFLKKYLKERPGKIVDTKGKILGEHKGLWFYTIGQRKGIGLSGGPYWVLDKDPKRNLLIVTKNEKDLLKKELICKNVNWILGKEPKLPLKIKIKIRYRTEFAKATIHSTFSHLRKCANIKNKIYKVVFEKPQRAITPGQSVVFYKGEEVLGGGIIF